ncbi:MAG: lipid-A-disaccharide synthase [Bacteroidaceae bacterium]|nr:lipid-A-disaccharide synthase [Bacteroidaceae bacterium]
MKYYLIAGETSGELHASHLMQALKERDAEAQFRFIGGEMMAAQGGELVRNYRELAYMGFVPVLTHLRTIFRGMSQCRADILQWQPDVLILVDYPGFNLSMAQYIKKHAPQIKTFYYISPKIWAWKEYRMKQIRSYIDRLYSILPFEVDYFRQRHGYEIDYVGNPTLDEVVAFQQQNTPNFADFIEKNKLSELPIIALLAGSRKQEIEDNLPQMLQVTKMLTDKYQLVVAGAPGVDASYYARWIGNSPVRLLYGQTYPILQHSTAALVTSGTATLETALFRVPQVVCYHTKASWFYSFLRRVLIKVPYVSLVNLVAGREVVPEFVAADMSVSRVRDALLRILPGGDARQTMLDGYQDVVCKLGDAGAPQRAAELMVTALRSK